MLDPDATQQSLTAHLRTLSEDRLTELLTARPDGLIPPVPGTRPELADRLLQRGWLTRALVWPHEARR